MSSRSTLAPPMVAERSKLALNRGRRQRTGPESRRNAANWPQIDARRAADDGGGADDDAVVDAGGDALTPNRGRTLIC